MSPVPVLVGVGPEKEVGTVPLPTILIAAMVTTLMLKPVGKSAVQVSINWHPLFIVPFRLYSYIDGLLGLTNSLHIMQLMVDGPRGLRHQTVQCLVEEVSSCL